MSDSVQLSIACVMLGTGPGGLEQSMVDYCEALLLEGHQVRAVIHPRAAKRNALERLPLAELWALKALNEFDPIAAARLERWLRRASVALVLSIGRRASVLTRRARRRLHHLPQVAVTPNYSLAPLVGLDHVIATTENLRHALIAAGQPAERISVLPNLVRVPAELGPRLPDPAAAPVIGALGRFVPKKGFAVLVEALALLRARGARFAARIGGSGPETSRLRTLIAHHRLDDCVRLLDWVEDRRAFFAALDVFCVPSLEEPFGIVVLEGLAHGVPTIVTDAAGPREIVTDGADGLIVPRGDPRALAAALATALADPDLRRELARAGRETARRRYDLPVVATRLSAVLHDVVRARSSCKPGPSVQF